ADAPAASGGGDAFTYDPADPTPAVHGPSLMSGKARGDMRALAARADVLRFDAEPAAGDVDLIGPVRASLRTRASSPHHDLFVCLCDVGPGGRLTNMSDGYLRLRPRDGDGGAPRTAEIAC